MRPQLADALVRAAKTFGQAALSLLTVNVVGSDVIGVNVLTVDWVGVLSVSTGAALLSLMWSLTQLKAPTPTPATAAVDEPADPTTDRIDTGLLPHAQGRHRRPDEVA